MKVFKTYLKILKTLMVTIIVYPVIFFIFNMTVNIDNTNKTLTNFEESKPKIFIKNNDDTAFTNSFTDYLKEHTEIVELSTSDEDLKDALFYRQVVYIIKIKEGFTKDFLDNKEVLLESLKLPDNNEGFIVENLVNSYLNTAKIYLKTGFSEKEIALNTTENLKAETNIEMVNQTERGSLESPKYYFNFSYYILVALCTAIIGLVMNAFNNPKVKKRTLCAPISISRYNAEITLGNLLVVSAFWLLFIGASFIFYKDALLSTHGLLFLINSLCIMIPILTLSLLIGTLVTKLEAQGAISTVVSLGTSFLTGVFVPMEFLGQSVLSFARIFPSYWFVLVNEKIASITTFTNSNVLELIKYMSIEVGMGIIIYMVMIIIEKKKIEQT